MAENAFFFFFNNKTKALKIYTLILFRFFAAGLASALYTVVQMQKAYSACSGVWDCFACLFLNGLLR